MNYVDGEVAEHAESPDGRRQFDLVKRHDGVWRYVEWTLSSDEIAGDYWAMSNQSGLFSEVALAMADAKANLPWIRPHS